MRRFIFSAFLSFSLFFLIAQPPTSTKIAEARERFNAGVKLGIDEQFSEAIEEFEKAIELNPLFAEAFLYLGLAKIELGEYDLAIRNFTIAIELDPAFSDQAHYFRGLSRYYNKDYTTAIDDFTIAIRMNPDFVSFYQRGKANLELKEYRRALQDFDIALRLKEDFPEGFLYRGINLYYLENFQEAMKDLDMALLQLPGNELAQKYAGLTARRLSGRYEEDIAGQTIVDPSRTVSGGQIEGSTNQDRSTSAATDINFAQLFSAPSANPEKVNNTEPVATASEQTAPAAQPETDIAQISSLPSPETYSIESAPTGTYRRDLSKVPMSGFGVQVASYSNTANLMQLAQAYEEKYNKPVFINVSSVNGRTLYKLIIGQFDVRLKAEEFRNLLREDSFPDSFLVVFDNL